MKTEERPDEDVLELAKRGNQDAIIELMRRNGERSPYYFSSVIAGYAELTPDFHQPICNWFSSNTPLERGLLMPRKYFKSSMLKGYVLRELTKPGGAEERILFVGENEDVGKKNVADLQWKFQQDKRFQALYPHLIPSDMGRDWPASALTLPRSRSYDEPTIQSVGIGTKYTGFHHTKIIFDDPIGLVAAQSKAVMDKAIEWFQTVDGYKDSVESLLMYIGTRWKHGKADLPGFIMAELGDSWEWIVRDCIEKDDKGEIDVSIFPPQISTTGKRIGYSIPDLMAMKKKMGTYLFNCNMRNNPTAGDDTDFKPKNVKTYKISEDRRAAILSDSQERIDLAYLRRISFYDPSAGGVSAEAENAIVVIGEDWKGRILLLDRWHKNCSFGVGVEHWHVMNDKWRCGRNYYEAVGAHKEVGEKFKDRNDLDGKCRTCGKAHRPVRPRDVIPPPGLKEDRIRDYAQTPFEEGRIYIGEWMSDIEKQILEFPHGELVDLLDALAYAIHLSKRPPKYDSSQAKTKKAAEQRKGGTRVHSTVDYGGY